MNLQMADAVGHVVRDDRVGESLDSLLLDGVLDRLAGGLALPDQVAVRALQHGDADAQSCKKEEKKRKKVNSPSF